MIKSMLGDLWLRLNATNVKQFFCKHNFGEREFHVDKDFVNSYSRKNVMLFGEVCKKCRQVRNFKAVG